MDIKLIRLQIENFKGVKKFEANFDGENAVISGQNGSGKTTVYDAFLYLLFGKDSTGRKDFQLRPLDEDNQPLKGLVLAVEAEISIDGTIHTLRKENHENVVKKQMRGYETLCYIDEVPKKISEYTEYISEIISEDVFRLLTDLHHFNAGLHWKERRATLLDIAGKIGTPKGFNELVAKLNGRTIAEYKSVLAEQKKRLSKERDEINPRIDEIQRGLDTYAGAADTADIEVQRASLNVDIKGLEADRQAIIAKETERQQRIENLNSLKSKKLQREGELRNDTTGIKGLLEEKAKIEAGIAKCVQNVNDARYAITLIEAQIKGKRSELDRYAASLIPIRDEYKAASESPTENKCFACGQNLPAENLEANEQKRKAKLASIIERGNKIQADVERCKNELAELEAELKPRGDILERAQITLKEAEDYKADRFAKIDVLVKTNQTLPPERDQLWQQLTAEIAKAESEIGEPVSKQLQNIEIERGLKMEALAKCNAALAQVDRMKKDKARIVELEAKERELAQQISEIDRLLASIDEYGAAESKMIEDAVNGKFKYVSFKLFNNLLNGSIEDCCEAMLNGVPYKDLSYGQKIRVGIDILSVLSNHYGLHVPLFLDNSESLTYPVEFDGQTIQLRAETVLDENNKPKDGLTVNVGNENAGKELLTH